MEETFNPRESFEDWSIKYLQTCYERLIVFGIPIPYYTEARQDFIFSFLNPEE
jgi:hypothetical protein